MKNKKILVSIGMVCIGIIGFFVGTFFEKNKSSVKNVPERSGAINGPRTSGMNRQGGGQNRIGSASGGSFTVGEILSVDEKSMTLKIRSGGSKIIFFNDSTQISKSMDATKTDIAVGAFVNVAGTLNSDGSVSSQSIQIQKKSL